MKTKIQSDKDEKLRDFLRDFNANLLHTAPSLKEFLGQTRQSRPRRRLKQNQQNKTRKSPNQFLVFQNWFLQKVRNENININMHIIPEYTKKWWQELPKAVKDQYSELARQIKEQSSGIDYSFSQLRNSYHQHDYYYYDYYYYYPLSDLIPGTM